MMTPRQHAGEGTSRDGTSGDNASSEWRLVSRMLVPCQVRSVKAARDHVARLVVANSLDLLLDDTEVVTSEIVTNAIMHGSPAGLAVLLEVAVADSAVRVSVLDYSDRVPVLRELPPDDAQSGRGLHLIDSLAKSWGYRVMHRCRHAQHLARPGTDRHEGHRPLRPGIGEAGMSGAGDQIERWAYAPSPNVTAWP
jgi:anti-sigma regulatory factor (Ser/Thr protein kinase)